MFNCDDYYERQDLDLDSEIEPYRIFGLHSGRWEHIYNSDSEGEAIDVASDHDSARGYYKLFRVVDETGRIVFECVPSQF